MSLDPGSPPPYLVGHLEDALARDPRVAEQGLRVTVEGEPARRVVVRGALTAPGRSGAVVAVIGELLAGVEIVDETSVADYPESSEVEEVP